jgi:hypothetical protein
MSSAASGSRYFSSLAPSATAPTVKYSTPFESRDSINARQSSGSRIVLLARPSPKLKQYLQPLGRRESPVIFARGFFGLAKASEFGHDRLHLPYFTPEFRI